MKKDTVSVYNMNRFETKFNAINRKAIRLGLPSMTYQIIGDIKDYVGIDNALIVVGKEVEISYQDIIKIDGNWSLVAVLDHTEGLIKVLPDQTMPEHLRTRGNVCDHCGHVRQRNETFVLYDGQEYRQVGRQCLGEFLGIDPSMILGQCDLSKELDLDSEDWTGKREPTHVKLENFLTYVSALIRLYGWSSRKIAQESGTQSTADLAWLYVFDMLKDKHGHKIDIGVTDHDKETGKLVADWMVKLGERNRLSDYLVNLAQIGLNEFVSSQSIGFAASAINAWAKEIEESRVKVNAGSHVGSVGDKLTAAVTLVSSYGFDSQYGYSYIHSFSDQDGNCIVWKTGSNGLDIGKSYRMVATIKSHDLYRGTPQTIVTRAKLK